MQNKLTLELLKPENNHKENIKILKLNTMALQEHLQHAIQKAGKNIPYKTPNHLSLPYIIREQIKYKNRLKRQARLTGDSSINTEANRCTNEIKKQIKKHRNKCWMEKLNSINAENQPNTLCKMAKFLTTTTKTNIPALHSNQGMVYTDEEKAKAFADTFENQVTLNTELTDDINREQ